MHPAPSSNSLLPPYLLSAAFNSRYHQHLNHLNDMAFNHTKILQEMLEKRSSEPMAPSPHGSLSSSSSSSTTTGNTMDSVQQRKRAFASLESMKEEALANKRSRKQSKPQQVRPDDEPSVSSEHDDEDEMGQVTSEHEEPNEKQVSADLLQKTLPPPNLSLMNYLQDIARTNHMPSPLFMGKFFENLQKEFLANSSMETKRLPPPPAIPSLFSQTVHHHHHHPYFSQVLLNNSFVNHFPTPSSLHRFPHQTGDSLLSHEHHRPYPFHFSTPKKRRTKVTDTRLSPRITTKLSHQPPTSTFDDLSEDEASSSNHSSDHLNDDQPGKSIAYNGFQIILTSVHLRKAKLMFFYTRYPSSSVLKVFFPDVRFNKLITAQLVKWFSNFREFFYSQIEKYARQYLAEGVRHVEDLIVTPNSDLYRILNLHYNRSNQIDVPLSFGEVVQATLREFFLAIQQQKDLESSWKKSIYKVIQRLDDQIPDFFKHDHWMHTI